MTEKQMRDRIEELESFLRLIESRYGLLEKDRKKLLELLKEAQYG